MARVEQFIYLGTILTNQNSIQEEIRNRLYSENAFYLSEQNILFSSLLSNNIQIIDEIRIILPVVYGFETWSLTLRGERKLRVSGNRLVRRIFGPKKYKVKRERREYVMSSLMISTAHHYCSGD